MNIGSSQNFIPSNLVKLNVLQIKINCSSTHLILIVIVNFSVKCFFNQFYFHFISFIPIHDELNYNYFLCDHSKDPNNLFLSSKQRLKFDQRKTVFFISDFRFFRFFFHQQKIQLSRITCVVGRIRYSFQSKEYSLKEPPQNFELKITRLYKYSVSLLNAAHVAK